jgi:Zn-dependent protease with chaperone function
VIALLLLVGAGLLVLPFGADSGLRRLPPDEGARLAVLSIGAGAALMELGLVLTAAPTVLRAVRVTGFAVICEHALGPLVAHAPIIGWAAAAVSVVLGGSFIAALNEARRAAERTRVEPWLGWHEDRRDHELVILPTARLLAISVPGQPPQVVVSEGLISSLAPDECEAVVRHELAHAYLGHRRYLLLLTGVERAFPWLPGARASAARARRRLEEWADDHAAGPSQQARLDVSGAIVGLACAAPPRPDGGGDEWGTLERVQRLQRRLHLEPRVARLMTYAPLVLLSVVAVSVVAGWFAESRHALAFGAYCPD